MATHREQPIFCNTMKNTVQRYGLSAYLQIYRAKRGIL